MKGCLKWVAILGGIFVVVAVIIVVIAGGGESASRARPAPTVRYATPTPEWMAPSFGEMCDNNDTMTDLQQEDYAASMAGKKIVDWSGEVYDVESGDADLYNVQVYMGQGIFPVRDIVIQGISRDIAAALNVEQKIIFGGTIKSVDMFAGDICNPINVIEATITPD